MPTTLLARFVNRFFSDEQAFVESSDESTFVPSRLDYSVQTSHGGGQDEAAREIRDIQEQAASHDLPNH